MAGEQRLQTKIMAWLKAEGFYAIKVVAAGKKGVPDIVGCTPTGEFFAIEVKFGTNIVSALQQWNIEEIRKRKAVAIVAYCLADVKAALKATPHLEPHTSNTLKGD